MTSSLDKDLQALKAAAPVSPVALEREVWRGIDAVREARGKVVPVTVRAASVCVALCVGLAGGSLAAVSAQSAHDISVFSIDTRLAPSTLLDARL